MQDSVAAFGALRLTKGEIQLRANQLVRELHMIAPCQDVIEIDEGDSDEVEIIEPPPQKRKSDGGSPSEKKVRVS